MAGGIFVVHDRVKVVDVGAGAALSWMTRLHAMAVTRSRTLPFSAASTILSMCKTSHPYSYRSAQCFVSTRSIHWESSNHRLSLDGFDNQRGLCIL